MITLHTTGDVSRFIGALELGALGNIDDGALEAAGTTAALNPTVNQMITACRHIDDGALEAVGTNAALNPPTQNFVVPGCRHMDDSALEAAGTQTTPTHTFNPLVGRCI